MYELGTSYRERYSPKATGTRLDAPAVTPPGHLIMLATSTERNYLRKTMLIIGGITFCGGLFVLLLAKPIITIAVGSKYLASVPVLQLMAFIPFACAVNNIYGTQGMLNFGMKSQYSRTIIVSAFLNNLILVPLCYYFKAPGAAVSGLIIETFVTLVMGMMLYGRGINLLPRVSDSQELAVSSLASLRTAIGGRKIESRA